MSQTRSWRSGATHLTYPWLMVKAGCGAISMEVRLYTEGGTHPPSDKRDQFRVVIERVAEFFDPVTEVAEVEVVDGQRDGVVYLAAQRGPFG